jgi:hypothetical protein
MSNIQLEITLICAECGEELKAKPPYRKDAKVILPVILCEFCRGRLIQHGSNLYRETREPYYQPAS